MRSSEGTSPETISAPNVDTERVSQIVRAFDRVLRSQRLYSANNPVLIRHQQELNQLFTQFFASNDELSITVEPFEFKVDGLSVYQNTNQQDSLAFRIFNDGVRLIRFSAGLTPEEITEFIVALNSSSGGETDNSDAVTAFWEKEFEHIEYQVADSIIDEPTLDEKSTDEKIDELIDPSMRMYHGAATEPDEDLYQDLKITLNMQSVGQMFKERTVLGPEEVLEIQKDIAECERPERLVLDFVDMVLAVMQEETELTDFEMAAQALGNILDSNLLHGRLDIGRMVMEQVHRFPTRPIELAKLNPNILSQSLKILWPVSRIDMLVQAINQEPVGTSEDLEILVSLIDPGALPYLLKQLSAIADVNRRKIVCLGIAKLHRGDLGIFLPMLSAKDPEMIRIGLAVVGSIQNEKAADLVIPLVQHPDLTIRKEAIAVLRNYRTPKTQRVLLSLLNDSSIEIRVLALKILSTSTDRELARQLTAVMNREEFQDRPLAERKAYFHAVAKIAGDDFLPFLADILNTRGWFKKSQIEEAYQCATYALGVVASPRAKELLQKSAASSNKSVRRLSQTALRILEGGPARATQ